MPGIDRDSYLRGRPLVFGVTVFGDRILRKSGRWYVEYIYGLQRVMVEEAAALAARGVAYHGLQGGRIFDHYVDVERRKMRRLQDGSDNT